MTQDSITAVSLWLNPNRGMTLEDVADTLQQFVHTMAGFSSQISTCTLLGFTVRGEVFSKKSLTLSVLLAKDKLHDGEPFTVQVEKNVGYHGCCLIL